LVRTPDGRQRENSAADKSGGALSDWAFVGI